MQTTTADSRMIAHDDGVAQMLFMTIAASDEDIRGTDEAPGKSQLLTRADLDELCTPGSWLTDALINYGVEECDAWGAPLGGLENGVLWIRPALVRAGMSGSDDLFDESVGKALGWAGAGHDKPTIDTTDLASGATIVLLPVNDGDTHWSLLAFYKGDACKFVHYDSLEATNAEAAKGVVAKLRSRGFLSQDFDVTESGDVVRQEDGYNCGTFVIQYARAIMTTGAEPSRDTLQAITSHSSEDARLAMQLALVPLIAPAEHLVGEWWEHPDEPLSKGESRPVEQDEESRKKALAKIHEALEEDNAKPIQLSSVQQCKLAALSTVVVVLASTKDEWHAVQGGSVTFTVSGESFSRPVSYDGTKWMTTLTTQFPKRVKVGVTAKVQPPAEFTETSASEAAFNHDPGANKTVRLTFPPRKPRRLHLLFVVEDPEENREIESEDEKIHRPFPKGTKLELLFDDGPKKATATIQADGTLVDDGDSEAGVRIPFGVSRVTPQFADAKQPRYLAWTAASDASSATVYLDDRKKAKDTQRVGFTLPTGVWIPTRRPDNWRFAAAHYDSKKLRPHLDVSKALPGSSDEPVKYVLESDPPPFLMNGHKIDHVVCLMLENRGFDHFMGFLYEGATKPKHSYPAPSEAKGKHRGLRLFEGLEGLSPTCPYDYDYETYYYITKIRKGTRKKVTKKRNIKGVAKMRRGAVGSNIPTTNPHEDFIHIFQDMYGKDVIGNPHDMEVAKTREKAVKSGKKYEVPAMNGWAQNFCDGIRHHRSEKETVLTRPMVDEIMQMYLPDQLPVMHGLARNYAVSDLWFCSVPSQTNTNRAFWASGHAAGICKNDWHPAIKYGWASDKIPAGTDQNGVEFRRSLFDVLEENGHSWKYYYSVPYPPGVPKRDGWKKSNYYYFKSMFPQFDKSANVTTLDTFYDDVRNGSLPRVSYIEPTWGGGKKWDATSPMDRAVGNEFHPVQDMFVGEFFVKEVYDAIVAGPNADTTVLIITFDENGGTYDHFPPWEAKPPGREANLPKGQEYGFNFDCFGVRVPTLLISKYVKSETIFRSPTDVPYDHTSVISTVLEWLAVPKDEWKLGDRVANAPSFAGALQGDGEEEADRREVATGLAHFDAARKKRISGGAKINYGETFHLEYRGNKWADSPPKTIHYLCEPTTYMNWWYPTVTTDVGKAIKFKFTGGDGVVKAGDELVIEATGTTGKKNKSMAKYSLGLARKSGGQKIYLYKGGSPSKWIPWLVNDRNRETELYYGDELFLLSEQYQPKNLPEPFSGVQLVDPYKRLTVDPVDPNATGATRYATWRAGEWDIWTLTKA